LPLARATRGPAMTERTATVIWQVLRDLRRPVFLRSVIAGPRVARASGN
jgi:hypothetical protein